MRNGAIPARMIINASLGKIEVVGGSEGGCLSHLFGGSTVVAEVKIASSPCRIRRPLASRPTRAPRTPTLPPKPDLDRFIRKGPSLKLLRKYQPIVHLQRRWPTCSTPESIRGGQEYFSMPLLLSTKDRTEREPTTARTNKVRIRIVTSR